MLLAGLIVVVQLMCVRLRHVVHVRHVFAHHLDAVLNDASGTGWFLIGVRFAAAAFPVDGLKLGVLVEVYLYII